MMRTFSLLILLALAACGVDSAADVEAEGIVVEDAWARPVSGTDEAQLNSAAYFQFHNFTDEPVTLIGAEADVAALAELHETAMEDGVMRMRHRDEIEVPPGESVSFEPGGLHVMLMELTRDLVEGDSLTMHLHFADGREHEVLMEVQAHLP